MEWLFTKNIALILSTYTVIGNATSISIDCSTIVINFNVVTTSDNTISSTWVVEITTPFKVGEHGVVYLSVKYVGVVGSIYLCVLNTCIAEGGEAWSV